MLNCSAFKNKLVLKAGAEQGGSRLPAESCYCAMASRSQLWAEKPLLANHRW